MKICNDFVHYDYQCTLNIVLINISYQFVPQITISFHKHYIKKNLMKGISLWKEQNVGLWNKIVSWYIHVINIIYRITKLLHLYFDLILRQKYIIMFQIFLRCLSLRLCDPNYVLKYKGKNYVWIIQIDRYWY
jgi:hypothetical protein